MELEMLKVKRGDAKPLYKPITPSCWTMRWPVRQREFWFWMIIGRLPVVVVLVVVVVVEHCNLVLMTSMGYPMATATKPAPKPAIMSCHAE